MIIFIRYLIIKYICYHRSVGLKFNLAKSSLSHCVRRVVQVLCKISIDVIKWPSIHNINTTTEKFKRIAGLKDVVGAIDGTHIEIPAPSVCFYNFTLLNLIYSLNNENMYSLQIDTQYAI